MTSNATVANDTSVYAKPFTRKLTDEQVAEIARRCEDGESRKDLALEFGISVVYVGQLGRTRRVTERSAEPVLVNGFKSLREMHVRIPEWLIA